MKKLLSLLLCALLLTGCAAENTPAPTQAATAPTQAATEAPQATVPPAEPTQEIPYVSRFDTETAITLSDSGITVNGGGETESVYTSHDIVYYEDRDTYDSGNPYGEGTAAEKHTAAEAQAHTVVNITAPGAYRVSGSLSAGQLRIDLGDAAFDDPDAVVELILDNADITCTVAPAILFQNVYECDHQWSVDTASPNVDTSNAGAKLVLEGQNTVTGSHVARIYKDKEGEKKLWKQDGALYSYMSLNIYGPGSLDLTADNEGLDTELHLTINGGKIAIRSQDDGINTNEDGVSVTAINAGSLHIIAGLGSEGDGIDSNGYLVINGGTVVSSAHPAADAGLDSDMGSFIHGGTVVALGSTMDWAESDSEQVTMNLQFASQQDSGSAIVVTREDGTVIFAYDPSEDEVLGANTRRYQGAILSCPSFQQSESYQVWLDGVVSGSDEGGVYDASTITAYSGGTQQAYTGTDVTRGPGGFGGQRPQDFGGEMPEGFDPGQGFGGEMPEGFDPGQGFGGGMPEDFDPSRGFGGGMPEDFDPSQGFGGEIPEGFEGEMPTMPQSGEIPESFGGQRPQGGGYGGLGDQSTGGEANTSFYMQDKVNAFSGIAAAK